MIEDLKWAAPDRYDILKEFARKNRLMPTLAEAVLWEQIRGKALEYDESRTLRLERLGFHVIRFSNDEIVNSIGNVVKTIQTNLLK